MNKLLIKSGVDLGVIFTLVSELQLTDILQQILVAVGVVVVNSLLLPLLTLFVEWLKKKVQHISDKEFEGKLVDIIDKLDDEIKEVILKEIDKHK